MISESQALQIVDVAIAAGEIIMGYYKKDYEIFIKPDNSQVTSADLAADQFISGELSAILGPAEIISEESYKGEIVEGEKYWLIDPLDGTRNFLQGNKNFVVSIGLIDHGVPIFGVIYHPISKTAYYSLNNFAYEKEDGQNPTKISSLYNAAQGTIIVTNKPKSDSYVADFLNNYPNVAEHLIASSAVKYCMLAAGKANLYPCFSKTMTWDTAGGHAILRAAGGEIYELDAVTPLRYSKYKLSNPFFIANGNCVHP